MLITILHGLFYKEDECSNHELYEVGTRKVLMWPNIIVSSSNVVAVAGMKVTAYFTEIPALAKKGWQYLVEKCVSRKRLCNANVVSDLCFVIGREDGRSDAILPYDRVQKKAGLLHRLHRTLPDVLEDPRRLSAILGLYPANWRHHPLFNDRCLSAPGIGA